MPAREESQNGHETRQWQLVVRNAAGAADARGHAARGGDQQRAAGALSAADVEPARARRCVMRIVLSEAPYRCLLEHLSETASAYQPLASAVHLQGSPTLGNQHV